VYYEQSPTYLYRTTGWLMKMFHTFFDYWIGSIESMNRTGLALGDWPEQQYSKTTIGHPPAFGSDDKAKGDKLIEYLFNHVPTIDHELKVILAANGLRHMKQFTEFLLSEPHGKFRTTTQELDTTKCVFMNTLNKAFAHVQISPDMSEKWQVSIERDFWYNNIWSMPEFRVKFGATSMNEFPPSFTFNDYFLQQTQMNQVLQETIMTLHTKIDHSNTKIDHLSRIISDFSRGQASTDHSGNTALDLREETTYHPLNYDTIKKLVKDCKRVDDKIFVAITHDIERAFNTLSPSDRTKEKSYYSKLQKASRMVKSSLQVQYTGDSSASHFKLEIERVIADFTRTCRDAKVLKHNQTLSLTAMNGKTFATAIQK